MSGPCWSSDRVLLFGILAGEKNSFKGLVSNVLMGRKHDLSCKKVTICESINGDMTAYEFTIETAMY